MPEAGTNVVPDEISLCSRVELARDKRVNRWVEEWKDEVLVFDRQPHPLVVSGVCPHFGGELDLLPSAGRLRCRWHGWEFEAESGRCVTYPIKGCIRHFKSEWRGDTLVVFRNANP